MSVLNLSVLAIGSLFVAIPVVLHLLMRRKPRHAVFPALRFVKAVRRTNQRRLRLRQWLLLFLRCAVVGALAAALARPTVASDQLGKWLLVACLGLLLLLTTVAAVLAYVGRRGPWLVSGLSAAAVIVALIAVAVLWQASRQTRGVLLGSREAPVAAALVFDSSPRMLYRQGNQTRLEAAQELGQWLLTQLPEDSEVAVVDAGASSAVFSIDTIAANKAIQALQVDNLSLPMTRPFDAALRLLESSEKRRKEIYLLSDLTTASWADQVDSSLPDKLRADLNLKVYILDVGIEDPHNVSLGDLKLAAEFVASSDSVRIETDARATGSSTERTVELLLEKPDSRRPIIVDGQPLLPELLLRDEKRVTLAKDATSGLEFSLQALDAGVHHGQIRIRGEDGLVIDNVRYFTIHVTDAWPVLVAAPQGAASRFLTEALEPYLEAETQQAMFRCDTIGIDSLNTWELADYRVVAMLDPPELPIRVWRRLVAYVEQGGSAVFFLGRNAQPVNAFHMAEPRQLLPGQLARQWRATRQGVYLSLDSAAHPMLRAFQPIADVIPWNQFPVYRHWVFDEMVDDASVIMRFGNGKPAIVERRIGLGRSVVMMTPISDPLNVDGRPPWNYLPTGVEPWPFFVLGNEMFRYLAQQGDSRVNYVLGQTASFTLPAGAASSRFQLFVPQGSWQDVTADQNRISVSFADQPGSYRLRSTNSGGLQRGFAMNLPAETTRLDRIDAEQLNRWFGPGRYRIARNRDELNRDIGEARMGSELYPWIVVFVVMLLALEYVLANRFYSVREK